MGRPNWEKGSRALVYIFLFIKTHLKGQGNNIWYGNNGIKFLLLHKVQCFKRITGTDNLTCEIIYDNFTCENFRFSNNHQSWLRDILYW